ncbi:hypothetical protein LKO27_14805 [Tessaracoccus sp. OS52]|uniref:hypothetical protein n=1 Tax=Tessaracoccus sp. OS52 TaxID=2886691 RepID=UPI001D0F5174|nr:hypothetical protein [Tessaracoccus sp. OS52]MCC2594672.1 hypothetical protein [Tessaracoccus sp. OS52]
MTEIPAALAAFVAADRRQDTVTMRAQLSPSVRLVSPLTDGFTFDGPDDVIAVYESAFEVLRDMTLPDPVGGGRDWVLHGTNTLAGRNLEEVQLVRLDDDGLIEHITLLVRPVSAAVALLSRMGGPLAARHALRPAARLTSRAAIPLALVMGFIERRVLPRLGKRLGRAGEQPGA